jgi:1-acyl-sn-glycerol-3-phosphate acyltransferase
MQHPNRQTVDSDVEIARRLLDIVRALSLEIAPGRAREVTLDSELDRQLGFDSLSRVELLQRVEQHLGARLSESVFASAETPRDLLEAVLTADSSRRSRVAAPELEDVRLGSTGSVPARIDTLPGVLMWRAERDSERTHVLLYETDSDTPTSITYESLLAGAKRIAAGLIHAGVEPSSTVAIMLPTGREYFESFFGAMLAGAVPVPIYPPARPSQMEDHLRRHARILDNAGARALITTPEGKTVGRLLKGHAQSKLEVMIPSDIARAAESFTPVPVAANDLAMLQYTSGSTGQPKGVMLTHADLLANIRAMGEWVRAGPDDVFVSWLPLYHDMGLIGAWLGSLHYAMLAVLMPPTAFLTRPWQWLHAIHRHGGTISAAPNFAYEMCVTKVPDAQLEGVDLASWRLACNGAEPVSPHTVRRFCERFAKYGFDGTAMTPVYGLAESAVGLAFPPLGRGPIIDRVDRDSFERAGRAEAAAPDDRHALEFVACGQPLPGYEIRIQDDANRELPEGRQGRLEFRGPSATSGYMNNPEATRELIKGGWHDSGDLAYVKGGDVYLTSRIKDMIIRAGRNIHPYELEQAVGEMNGIRKGCVAVFGSADPGTGIERLVVLAETRESDPETLQGMRRAIESLASDLLGVGPDDVQLVPPRTVLKTSSGKIRRTACRELYEQGKVGRGPRSVWWQVARLWATSLLPRWHRGRRTLGDLMYAAWAHLMFLLSAAIAIPALAVVPGVTARWKVLSWVARTLLRLLGVPLRVRGEADPRRHGPAILVANHASYADGLVLLAVLRAPVSFVAKAELRNKLLPNWFLRRIDTRFVERFDAKGSVADAREVAKHATGASPLLYFPEGTFTRSPGLRPFHMGAFVTAAENGLPVLPITIRGSRSVLRPDSWFPRRGSVTVTFGERIEPGGSDWQAALALRDRAREQILDHLGEPDLAPRETPTDVPRT